MWFVRIMHEVEGVDTMARNIDFRDKEEWGVLNFAIFWLQDFKYIWLFATGFFCYGRVIVSLKEKYKVLGIDKCSKGHNLCFYYY